MAGMKRTFNVANQEGPPVSSPFSHFTACLKCLSTLCSELINDILDDDNEVEEDDNE